MIAATGHCPFCRNIAGIPAPRSGPCAVITEDELTFTFVNPVAMGGSPGHVLVVPRRHAAGFLDLTEQEAAAIMKAAQRVTQAIQTVQQPDGILIQQRNGEAAGQDVFHYHLHVIPRAAGAPFPPDRWLPFTPDAERAELAARLRCSLQQEGPATESPR